MGEGNILLIILEQNGIRNVNIGFFDAIICIGTDSALRLVAEMLSFGYLATNVLFLRRLRIRGKTGVPIRDSIIGYSYTH